jgi:hypothetical protein
VRLINRVLRLLVAGVLTSAASTLGGLAAAAPRPYSNGIELRLVDAPVKARADSRAWRYIIDHLPPGSVIHRRVQVANTTSAIQHLTIYAAAADVRNQRFQLAPGHTPNELSTWTGANRHEVTLAPHARSMVTTTIAVPDDAAPGERYAVIWAEAAKAAPPGGGVAEVNRVGIRIYLSVGRGNPPPSAFTIDSLTAERSPTGQQIVLAQVHNTGGRALDLSGDLKLTNSSGSLTAGPFKAQTGTTLAPGGSGPVAVLLDEQLPAGPWRARIRLQSGLTKRAAEATITFPLAGTAQSVKAETDLSYYPIAALVIGVVLSALMALKVVLIQRKRRIRPRTSR